MVGRRGAPVIERDWPSTSPRPRRGRAHPQYRAPGCPRPNSAAVRQGERSDVAPGEPDDPDDDQRDPEHDADDAENAALLRGRAAAVDAVARVDALDGLSAEGDRVRAGERSE